MKILDFDYFTEEEFIQLENSVEKMDAAWKIQNLRGIQMRFHDDQHIGEKRKELMADKHPSVDMKSVEQSRMKVLVENLEGNALIHPLTTPIIEINEQINAGRAVFMSFGLEGLSIHREEPMAIWSMGFVPGNYIVQDGEWRMLNGNWQRTVKANFQKGWVLDMQKTNSQPPLTAEEDRKFLGKYAYQKDEIRKPIPAPPAKTTFDVYPEETDLSWVKKDMPDIE